MDDRREGRKKLVGFPSLGDLKALILGDRAQGLGGIMGTELLSKVPKSPFLLLGTIVLGAQNRQL